jgi:3-deoxy-manno-octulosonate cytidylyltransferase (CMP-KDO synthetase)
MRAMLLVVLGVIPARWRSTRFPGKPLALLAGRPLIEHVWRRARGARLLDRLLVATDDPRIAEAVRVFGGESVMTAPDHPSGSDRVAEVARDLPCEVVVNIQGDEPLIEPDAIDAAVRPLLEEPGLDAVTLAAPIVSAAELASPHVVKVVRRLDGDALYFSRSPIPHRRDVPGGEAADSQAPPLRHLGLYAWRRAFLLELAGWAPTPLETMEGLEQLRILEHARRLRVVLVASAAPGVDTPEDLARLAGSMPPCA